MTGSRRRWERPHWSVRQRWSVLILLVWGVNCGSPDVSVTGSGFEPKIVIQGYLYPGRGVSVLLTRNFPLRNGDVNRFDLVLEEATAILTDGSDRTFELEYEPTTLHHEYDGEDLVVDFGATYALSVDAVIDGKSLSAGATTTVPERGFSIAEESSLLVPLHYRERDLNGDLRQFEIAFARSPGVDFYALSLLALEASSESFVYDNPYRDDDADDVNFFLEELRVYFDWIQNPAETALSSMRLNWFGLPFVGPYRAILYAADQNLKDFFLTHATVQDIDGNFHEPVLHIEGDGIGVFGSAIVDTVFFEVLP